MSQNASGPKRHQNSSKFPKSSQESELDSFLMYSTAKSFSPNLIPLALALNISIGGIILLIGSRLNPDTRNMNLN